MRLTQPINSINPTNPKTINIDKIQYLSDVHLEYGDPPCKNEKTANVVALLGDIGDPLTEPYSSYIHEMARTYDIVFLILGNHEYFGHFIHQIEAHMAAPHTLPSNVIYLQNSFVEFANVCIWGSTLWTNIDPAIEHLMSDYKYIHDFHLEDARMLHKKAVRSLERAIQSANDLNKKLVVLTHHAPLDAMNGPYLNEEKASAYATDLSRYFEDPIVGWLCGHTHQNMCATQNGIPCMANCYGYPNECLQPPFDPQSTFQVHTECT
jgi:predicted phosphohydrolase